MEASKHSLVKFSMFFIRKWRVSLLILIGIVGIGAFTYLNVLNRESMPPVEVPIGVVVTPYFVNDQDQVNAKITTPIEKALNQITEVKRVTTETDANTSSITIEFNEGTSSQDGINLVKEALSGNILPANVVPNYITIDAAKIDGLHDLIFAVYSDTKSIKDIQAQAEIIAAELEKDSSVGTAEVIPAIKEDVNPITGETIEHQVLVGRVGFQKDDEITFADAVYIGVNKKNDTVGTIDFSTAVRDAVAKIDMGEYGSAFSMGDPATSLNQQIDDLQMNALEALLIVLFVIAILINWRASLVTIIFIPTVLAATAIGFMLIGYTINTMTLFALVLVLGLFVDDAIVVVEAIDAQKHAGKKGLEALQRAIQKVGYADILGTFTTMLVFVPMAMISGIMGDFIRIMPVTVIIALALSLVIALTIIPYLSNLLIADKGDELKKKNLIQKLAATLYVPGDLVTRLGGKVSEIVNYYLGKPLLTIGVVVASLALVVLGVSSASNLPFALFPAPKDSDMMALNVNYVEGTTIAQAEIYTQSVETLVKEKYGKDITNAIYFSSNENGAAIYFELTPMKEREVTTSTMTEELNNEFADIKEFRAKADVPSAGPSADEYSFQMQVYAEDSVKLKEGSDAIKAYLMGLEVSKDVKVEDVLINNVLNISKIDGKRNAVIRAKLTESKNSSGDLQTLTDKVKDYYTEDKLKEIGLEKDSLGFDLGMESEMMGSFNSMIVGTLIALIVMYAILVFRFDSYTQPLLVFLGIPFSFVLLFPGLKATDTSLSFFVVLGITALTGILANNIIMLLDFARMRVIEENKDPREAIVGAIKRRFRPLISTSLITILGLLPLALNDPFWSPLAFSIIFGLIACTTLVIFALPAYYYLLERSRRSIKNRILKLVRRK